MTIEQTKKFMERIKSHYQEFSIENYKVKEWHEILKEYDDREVNEELTRHLTNDVSIAYIPKVTMLVKFLTKCSDKGKIVDFYTNCKICGKQFKTNIYMQEVKEHEDRCRSIRYLKKVYKKYLNRTLENINDLYSMSKDNFTKNYDQVLRVLLTKDIDTQERERINLYFESEGDK